MAHFINITTFMTDKNMHDQVPTPSQIHILQLVS